ncbi:hypothetical protein SAMN05444920_11950 [Nonomuraea solani]|uniref:DUF7824 domain-containing protein n=1 Tax=Nonomuraea solani TaxID=1144553 RepID=A0A1H6ETC0_9ACTN|nr:DUF6493 family protein [Nonomuraea solani]SEH01120.1 hypothetical protein SAMN05444920_11950 [Nonomuraea solani]
MTTQPPTAWPGVRAAITTDDPARVADAVLALDEDGRREVARELPGHIGTARKLAADRRRRQSVWTEAEEWIEPMRVAGAGVLGGAAAVTTWLYRRDFTRWRPPLDSEPLLRVIAARPPEWQADLAVRLTLRLRGTRAQARDDSAPLALELLRRTRAVPPVHDPLMVAWVSQPPDLANDPLAEHLVPRLFEAEGVGRVLREDTVDARSWESGRRTWLGELRDAVAAGRFDPGPLVDGCVRRFLRGGSATDLRFFARLHELLAPAPAKERNRDYLRLLPAAPGPVADLALRQLRGAGGLSGEEVDEAVSALLFRPEGKLVRAGLTLLDQTARDTAGDLDDLAPALASAFLCESYDVRERTVRLALKHAARFTPAGAEAVREAAGVLPPVLAARLSQAYGVVVAEPEAAAGFEPKPLPPFVPIAREPFPPPIDDLTATSDHVGDGITFERWIDAFVRDPSPRPRPGQGRIYNLREWHALEEWTEALLREAANPGEEPPVPEPEPAPSFARHTISVRTEEGDAEVAFGRLPAETRESITASLTKQGIPLGNLRRFKEGPPLEAEILSFSIISSGYWSRPEDKEGKPRDRLPDRNRVSAPHHAMLMRCAEIHAALKAGTLPPYLLATPTLTSGHLDPAELVARLEGYERAGVEAMPADLGQALLRLPREVDAEVIDRAGKLTSPAGARLVRWLAGRREPALRVDWSHGGGDYTHDRQQGGHSPSLRPRIAIEPTGLPLIDALLSDPRSYAGERDGVYMGSWWLTLPSDREAVAMHLLPHLLNSWDRHGYFHEYVAALFSQDGPVGEAMALLIAVQLAEQGFYAWADRGRALLLGAAAAGCLPTVECGRQLGLCLRRGVAKMVHVRAELEECAKRGAHRQVWEIMTGLLPVYLPGPDERPYSGHTQALTFAIDAARWAGASGSVPVVAEVAARKGSSGFVRTARTLHEQLTGEQER